MRDVLALHCCHPIQRLQVKQSVLDERRLRVVLEPEEVDVVDERRVRATVVLQRFAGAGDDEAEVELLSHSSEEEKSKNQKSLLRTNSRKHFLSLTSGRSPTQRHGNRQVQLE